MRWFHIISTAKTYLVALTVFSVFRLILFITELGRIDDNTPLRDILGAFIMGLRFDIVISGYIMALPYLALTILTIGGWNLRMLRRVIFYFIIIGFGSSFLVCAADIPYFNQFFSRFSITAFEWINQSPDFVISMILEEPSYWLSIIPFGIFLFLFYKALQIIWADIDNLVHIKGEIVTQILISVFFLGLMFLGVRGRIEEKSPIRIGTAYVFDNAFLNQLGLNPNFTFIRSYLDSKKPENKAIQLIPNEQAVKNVQKYLKIKNTIGNSPIARKVTTDSIEYPKYNIVLVIMESMSAEKMTRHGNAKKLTPFLDQLTNEGLYFENTYTAGIHTFNGIFSTLFSFPALFRQHPMKNSSMLTYNGISHALKQHGYNNIYFTTHDGQFDNAEGFLRANHFDSVISKENYPSEKIHTTLGVSDDYLFEYSIPIINKLSKKTNPFFVTFMTASDHGPYYIPEYFSPKSSEVKDQIVEYADWSLKKFVDLAKKEPWYKNTLFVFIADHGSPIDGTYEMPLSYNHTPLIFYNPNIIKTSKVSSSIAGQIDVFPTTMGLLNLSYTNNTLGIDLLKEERPYIFFNGDDKYGIIDKKWLLIVRDDNTSKLYKYQTKDTKDHSKEHPEIVDKMKNYAVSNLQTYQYMMLNGMQDYQ